MSAVRFLGSGLGVRGWWSLQGRFCCLTVWVCGVGLGERVLTRRCHCCARGPRPGSCPLVSISWRVKWWSRTERSQSGLWLHPKPAPSFGYTQVLSLKTGGRGHQIPVLVSSGLPGGSDKFLSPRRWQPELFLEQLVVGEFPFGSGWGRESWAGEVPCRDRAGPSSSTSPGTERPPRSPEVLGPCEHLPFNPEPRPSRSSAEATLQGTGLCPASHCWDPLTLSSHLGLLSLSLRVCLASDRETGPRDLWGLDLGCLSAPAFPLTTRRVGAASGPGPSAWHGLCHCPGWRGSHWVIPDFPELPRLRGKWKKY